MFEEKFAKNSQTTAAFVLKFLSKHLHGIQPLVASCTCKRLYSGNVPFILFLSIQASFPSS